jgi:hypothetical protein
MLVWVTSVVGSVVIITGALMMSKVDRRWRREHLQCCRCLEVWFSRDKLCRCGGSGNPYNWLVRKYAGFPTHDWQGYLDTAPIRRTVAARSGFTISGTTVFDGAYLDGPYPDGAHLDGPAAVPSRRP